MKVIFLDIDGVLNSKVWLDQQPPFSLRENPEKALDPNTIMLLNKVLEASGAKVVMTSTWRMKFNLNRMKRLFIDIGCKADIIGFTDVFMLTPSNIQRRTHSERENEIIMWLDKRHDVETFIIVDDLQEFVMLSDRLVNTNPLIGFTEDDVRKCLLLLTGKENS